MEWREEAVVLGLRHHGETSVIAEIMTRARGRHLGIVRGGRSRRLRPVLQPGNDVDVTWRARLDEHMGTFIVEPLELRAAKLMESAVALHGVQLLASHLRLLAERDPHPRLFDGLKLILQHFDDPLRTGEFVLRFEAALLEELGFGLDLSACAATGRTDDLVYVSPKSGRAVGREAGEPWRGRLLPLPDFLRDTTKQPERSDIVEGFRLTGYFLSRHVWSPRAIEEPASRAALTAAIATALA